MAQRTRNIPVIDIFAGPGGLGEGFSAFKTARNQHPFKIALSVEKEEIAHRTLLLRSFYRQFLSEDPPSDYYLRLRGKLTTEELFARHPDEAGEASAEAWRATLGDDDEAPLPVLRQRIDAAMGNPDAWVLIGGPPCQAYSLVGRSRNKGKEGYSLKNDPKARLYVEYLQLIADFWPAVFVMENVKGLLSSRIDGDLVFDEIRSDLVDPADAIRRHGRRPRPGRKHTYTLRALAPESLYQSPADFLIRAEQFGIPQARHRIIVIGVRDDFVHRSLPLLLSSPAPTVEQMIRDLPPIRSGLSKEPDGAEEWTNAVLEICSHRSLRKLGLSNGEAIGKRLLELPRNQRTMRLLDRGEEFCSGSPCVQYDRDWFVDPRLDGFCNHSSRGHIRSDLHRYAFAAAFAEAMRRSPELSDFPRALHPEHANVSDAIDGAHFADRFRVQCRHRYATTITSHISKDGHYYIHYDPAQCRSLTVREAARLQTFPDNYFFEGPRTAQYVQVGNAVPPLLARQIASAVHRVLE